MKQKIIDLLATNLSNATIANGSGVHLRAIDYFRKGERKVENMTLETAEKLINYYDFINGDLHKEKDEELNFTGFNLVVGYSFIYSDDRYIIFRIKDDDIHLKDADGVIGIYSKAIVFSMIIVGLQEQLKECQRGVK